MVRCWSVLHGVKILLLENEILALSLKIMLGWFGIGIGVKLLQFRGCFILGSQIPKCMLRSHYSWS